MIASASHHRPFHNKCEPHAIMQAYRPVEERFNNLAWEKDFTGRKQQAFAADIQALADRDPVQTESRPNPPAADCQPKGETLATPAIGTCLFLAYRELSRRPVPFGFARYRHHTLLRGAICTGMVPVLRRVAESASVL
jgi:hypothetical protein